MKKRATVASVVATAAPAVTVAKPDEHVRGCNTPSCDKRIGGRWAKKHRKPKTPAVASWYGPGFYGHHLACGGTLEPGTVGVAHKGLACGTKIRLCLAAKRGCASQVVKAAVIDRGPYVAGRTFDLTAPVKNAIGMGGIGTVRYAVVGS